MARRGSWGRGAAVAGCVLAAAAASPAPPASASRIGKLGRILALEDRRTTGSGGLERLLGDVDRGVRRRAALAAGRIGDPAVLPALLQLLNDGEPEVRQMSAFALGLIGDAQAEPRLVAALKDPEASVRGRAAEALGRLGDARAAAEVARYVLAELPQGSKLLTIRGDDAGDPRDPWIELRLGLFALARLKDAGAAASVLLVSGQPRFDWWAATWTAMRLESPTLKPVLLAGARSSDPVSRAFAARGLGALKDASAFELLASLAKDREATVVVEALRAVASLGDARGVGVAAAALASPDPLVDSEALRALAKLPPDPGLRARIVPYAGSKQAVLRAAALAALAHADPDGLPIILSGMDPDPVWFVRGSLATALGAAGDETSLGILFSMLNDEDARVLPYVLEALLAARGADATETLRRYLEHPDVAVRAAAAQGLADLKVAGQTEALASAYHTSLQDLEPDARLAEVAALAAQKGEAAKRALLAAATSDPARVVRTRAGEALRARGEPAPPPGPESVERPPLDYREAMRPYDPLPGVPLYTPRAFLHTRRGTIEIHLNALEAPLASASFIHLARRGFFDGLPFHRVVPDFVIQGGDPRGDGNGGPGYTLRCEIGERPYGRGTVGMALSGKDTGGSQFFVTLAPTPHLDGGYTVIGWVAAGMEVADRIQPGDLIERVEIWDGR